MQEITPEVLKKIGFVERQNDKGEFYYEGMGTKVTFGKDKGVLFGNRYLPLEEMINAIQKLDLKNKK